MLVAATGFTFFLVTFLQAQHSVDGHGPILLSRGECDPALPGDARADVHLCTSGLPDRGLAFVTALLFAVHPVHTEAVSVTGSMKCQPEPSAHQLH